MWLVIGALLLPVWLSEDVSANVKAIVWAAYLMIGTLVQMGLEAIKVYLINTGRWPKDDK